MSLTFSWEDNYQHIYIFFFFFSQRQGNVSVSYVIESAECYSFSVGTLLFEHFCVGTLLLLFVLLALQHGTADAGTKDPRA